MKNVFLFDNILDEKGVPIFVSYSPYPLVKNRHIVNQSGISYKLDDIPVDYTIKDVYEVEVGLNYATLDTNKKDIFYIETNRKDGWDSIITVTVEEAEWIAKNLMEFVEEFKKSKEKSE